MKISFKYCSILLLAVCLFSFISADEKPVKLPKEQKEKFSFIPGGNAIVGKDTVKTDAFFISKYEVTNADYNTFLTHLKESGNLELFLDAQIDSLNWKTLTNYNEPFVLHYHAHPAFSNYPVVNISYQGATEYCKWLAKRLNEQNTSTAITFEVRLPTRTEWIRAATGDRAYNAYYSWGHSSLRTSKGIPLANYKNIGEENIHFDESSKDYKIVDGTSGSGILPGNFIDNADLTAPAKSYFPNDYGLYNMNGNVAEMVSEKGIAVGGSWKSTGYDVRTESIMNYEASSPLIGFRPVIIVHKGNLTTSK